MTIAYACVFLMIIFPYVFTVMAKAGLPYDNHDPRNFLATLTGWRQRAHFVQLNSFEITPLFGLAVIIAHLTSAYQPAINNLALIFVVSRIAYAICYLLNKASLRTLCFFVGLFCILGLFYISY